MHLETISFIEKPPKSSTISVTYDINRPHPRILTVELDVSLFPYFEYYNPPATFKAEFELADLNVDHP